MQKIDVVEGNLPPHSNGRINVAKEASRAIINSDKGNMVRQTILYGSTARGEDGLSSDVDLCVVIDDKTFARSLEELLEPSLVDYFSWKLLDSGFFLEGNCAPDCPQRVDLHVVDRSMASSDRRPFYENVRRDGLIIFESL